MTDAERSYMAPPFDASSILASIDGLALFDAVKDGDLELTKSILHKHPNILVNDSNENMDRPEHACLHTACQFGHFEIAKLLVKRGASIDGMLPLMMSYSSSDPSVPRLISPLHCASVNGFEEIVSFLIRKGANIETRIKCTCCDELRETPLELAFFQSHKDVAWCLLKGGAAVPDSLVDDYMCNPEWVENDLEMTQMFFKHKTNVECCECATLLHVACTYGSVKATLPLVQDENVEIDEETCEGKTALILASEFGHSLNVQMLLIQGADLEIKDKEGWTALHWACGKGYTEIAEMLLDQDADIESQERHGWTPLLLATQNGKLKTVQLLVSRGADIEIGGMSGWAPLHIACKFGSVKVARYLLDSGASIDDRNHKDWTPLHVACRHGHLKMVRVLLDRGADVSARVNGRTTPKKLAKKCNHVEIVQLLESRE